MKDDKSILIQSWEVICYLIHMYILWSPSHPTGLKAGITHAIFYLIFFFSAKQTEDIKYTGYEVPNSTNNEVHFKSRRDDNN